MIAQLDREAAGTVIRGGGYWQHSRRPLTSLFFVLPLLVLYEGGVLWLGPAGVRNGADVWMQQLLGFLGFGGFLLLPLLTIAILLGWHHTSRQPWQVSRGVLGGMAFESVALAVLLLVVADLQARLLALGGHAPICQLAEGGSATAFASHLVRYFGAGIYEELLFRLMLVPLVMAAIGCLIGLRHAQIALAVVLTSLLFAAAHHVGPQGEPYQLYAFLFRSVAGGFFALLFIFRGFGIAAGTHAFYDIFASMSA